MTRMWRAACYVALTTFWGKEVLLRLQGKESWVVGAVKAARVVYPRVYVLLWHTLPLTALELGAARKALTLTGSLHAGAGGGGAGGAGAPQDGGGGGGRRHTV